MIKKLWVYIKEHGLQDATNKRAINADDKLLAVFGKPQVSMFELAGRGRKASLFIAGDSSFQLPATTASAQP